ncbi:hypothetical protein NE235_30705 [Actinoallomurus spadix]|uniref:Uncharacterized protein n=1 Tax=Actinoallomurus spadix TaxID=79912 RepID=A0ABN0XUT6_9ACTN|nr:hypothetical protein [Actinoallomurus spadix]MCO5990488.1 hypothetical protein [Actinoallomurus spadix]
MKDGYVARWQGRDYDAVPGVDGEVRLYSAGPAEGFAEIGPGRFLRIVREDEVESLRYLRTRCTWRGEPFVVIGEHEGWVRVEYSGGRAPVAAALGLERVDIGVYQAWVARDEITGLHQELI